jgi:hypothetical protein
MRMREREPISVARAARDYENPYASPQVTDIAEREALPIGIWSFGDLVVAHRAAIWPKTCVRSGGEGFKAMAFPIDTQYPTWVLFVFLGSLAASMGLAILIPMPIRPMAVLGTVILNLVGLFVLIAYLANPTQIEFWLSIETVQLRKRKMTIALGLIALGILGLLLSAYLFEDLMIAGFFSSIIVIGTGARMMRVWGKVLLPSKVQREYTILRGAGSAFLVTLPAWPLGTI